MLTDALKFIWYDKSKMIGILTGIVISVFLIGQQLGIFSTMMNNVQGVARYNKSYIWVIDKNTTNALGMYNMDMRISRSLQSIPGIEKVAPVVVCNGSAVFPGNTKSNVTLIGVAAPDFIGSEARLLDGATPELLQNEGAVFVEHGDRSGLENVTVGEHFLINEKRVYCAGYTKGNSGFGSSYMVTSIERARYLSGVSPDRANVFLIRCDTLHHKAAAVISAINREIPGVRALPGSRLGTETMQYMLKTSNIAVSFGVMVFFALISGLVIVGLTMYASVNDRIRDYGTIKAIGGSNGLIRRMILSQALLYAMLGFSFAYGLLWSSQKAMEGGHMEVHYSASLIAFLMAVTLLLSTLGSLFALRKIIKLEPVQIFRM